MLVNKNKKKKELKDAKVGALKTSCHRAKIIKDKKNHMQLTNNKRKHTCKLYQKHSSLRAKLTVIFETIRSSRFHFLFRR